MKDNLTEYAYGEGAIKVAGRFGLTGKGPKEKGGPHRTIIAGVLCSPEAILDHGHWDMWEVEIILIPKRKFTANVGHQANEMITEGIDDFAMWGEPYFEQPRPCK